MKSYTLEEIMKIYNLKLVDGYPITYLVMVGEKAVGTATLSQDGDVWIAKKDDVKVGVFDTIVEVVRTLTEAS